MCARCTSQVYIENIMLNHSLLFILILIPLFLLLLLLPLLFLFVSPNLRWPIQRIRILSFCSSPLKYLVLHFQGCRKETNYLKIYWDNFVGLFLCYSYAGYSGSGGDFELYYKLPYIYYAKIHMGHKEDSQKGAMVMMKQIGLIAMKVLYKINSTERSQKRKKRNQIKKCFRHDSYEIWAKHRQIDLRVRSEDWIIRIFVICANFKSFGLISMRTQQYHVEAN